MGRPNGSNGYTAQQFIDAIPGTGGVISSIAAKVGCAWHTAKKYIDNFTTVNQAWSNERNKITDKAQHNIIKAINGGDLQMSKWWLQVMDPEFTPTTRSEITGAKGGPIETKDADSEQHNRAISTLAKALGAILPGEGTGGEGDLGAAE